MHLTEWLDITATVAGLAVAGTTLYLAGGLGTSSDPGDSWAMAAWVLVKRLNPMGGRYDSDRKVILINLDHPMVAAARGVVEDVT